MRVIGYKTELDFLLLETGGGGVGRNTVARLESIFCPRK